MLNLQVLEVSSAGTSGTVKVEDQRSYIKTETVCCKNPTDIHSILHEVCGKQTVDHSSFMALYNSDMSTADFELFPKLKEPMHGYCFSSLEKLSVVVTQVIWELNNSGTLSGIANLK